MWGRRDSHPHGPCEQKGSSAHQIPSLARLLVSPRPHRWSGRESNPRPSGAKPLTGTTTRPTILKPAIPCDGVAGFFHAASIADGGRRTKPLQNSALSLPEVPPNAAFGWAAPSSAKRTSCFGMVGFLPIRASASCCCAGGSAVVQTLSLGTPDRVHHALAVCIVTTIPAEVELFQVPL